MATVTQLRKQNNNEVMPQDCWASEVEFQGKMYDVNGVSEAAQHLIVDCGGRFHKGAAWLLKFPPMVEGSQGLDHCMETPRHDGVPQWRFVNRENGAFGILRYDPEMRLLYVEA